MFAKASDRLRRDGYVCEMRNAIEEYWDRRSIGDYLVRYTAAVLRSYVNPLVYRCLGSEALPADLREQLLASPHWTALARESTRAVSTWLGRIGVIHEP